MRSIFSLLIGLLIAVGSTSWLLREIREGDWFRAFGAVLFLGVAINLMLAVLRRR